MSTLLVAVVKKLLPAPLVDRLRNWVAWRLNLYAVKAYSQEGEDLILLRLLQDRANGFYVDVGAYHPQRYSNTYLLYAKGWRGINIDALPGSMAFFKQVRARDINLEAAISATPQTMTFFIFNEPALNTFDAELAASRNQPPHRIVRQEQIATRTLADILQRHLPPGQRIDLLSVDVEGLDLEVLRSNNWDVFKPDYLCVECFGMSVSAVQRSDIGHYLADQGYELYAKTANSVIFQHRSQTAPAA